MQPLKLPVKVFVTCVLYSIAFLESQNAVAASQLSIADAFQSALKRSETISEQDQRVIQAQERAAQVKGAILPNISGNATYFVQQSPPDPLSESFFPSTQPTVKLTVVQPIFRGLREFATLRQTKGLSRAQEQARDDARVQLYGEVANSYYTVLALETDLEDLNAQARLYEDRIDELKGRASRGESNSTDVLTAQAGRATILAQIKQVHGQLRSSRELFAFLTGLSPDVSLERTDALPEKAKALPDYLAKAAERPDVRAEVERLDAAEEGVAVAKGAHWPSADVVGNYYLKRPSGIFSEIRWDVQASLTLPIYSGGAVQSQVREAVSLRSQAELSLSRARRRAEQEIRAAYETYIADLEQIEALDAAMALAERNYSALRKDYRHSLARNIDVLQGLAMLQDTKRALHRARFAAKNDLVRLLNAAGRSPALH